MPILMLATVGNQVHTICGQDTCYYFAFLVIAGLYFQTLDMIAMDLASLVAVSVVAVACSLLSLLLATLCWQQWEISRPSHTYCAQCLYGAVR